MSDTPTYQTQTQRQVSMDRRIAELQARPPAYINHGEALLFQGMATASLREQRLAIGQIALED